MIIPWLYNGRDRTFFFFSNENLFLQTPSAAQTYYVPSMALRSEASPVFKAFLAGFPVSAGPDLGATVPGDAGFSQLVGGFSVPSRINANSLRLDHNISDKPLWKTQWDKFAPRLGFAYRLRDSSGSETVVRGGAGLFYDTANMAASTAGITGASATNNNYGCMQPTATDPATTCVTWPIALSNFPSIAAAALYPAEVDPHLKSPYTLQWNVAVQQSLGAINRTADFAVPV